MKINIKIIKKESFCSADNNLVNKTDDMYRVTIYVSRKNYPRLERVIDELSNNIKKK